MIVAGACVVSVILTAIGTWRFLTEQRRLGARVESLEQAPLLTTYPRRLADDLTRIRRAVAQGEVLLRRAAGAAARVAHGLRALRVPQLAAAFLTFAARRGLASADSPGSRGRTGS